MAIAVAVFDGGAVVFGGVVFNGDPPTFDKQRLLARQGRTLRSSES